MNNDELLEQKCRDVLAALDKAITEGPWESSNFLSVVGKKLQKIREDFIRDANLEAIDFITPEAAQAERLGQRAGQQEVYINLYSSEGANIKAWERILANLTQRTISRPIYEEENDAINIIKTKENKQNEAYIAIYVNPSDLLTLSADKMPYDKLGRPMLTLKDRAISLENISRFVYNAQSYLYKKGALVRENE